MERGVEHVHGARVEVGGVKAVAGCGTGDGKSLIDGAPGRVVDGDDCLCRRHRRAPPQDRALLGGENEAGGSGGGAARHDKAGTSVEDHAGRRAGNAHPQGELGARTAVVERRGVGAVVGDPPRRGRTRHQSPGVDEGRIDEIRRHRPVRHQVVLLVERQRAGPER